MIASSLGRVHEERLREPLAMKREEPRRGDRSAVEQARPDAAHPGDEPVDEACGSDSGGGRASRLTWRERGARARLLSSAIVTTDAVLA